MVRRLKEDIRGAAVPEGFRGCLKLGHSRCGIFAPAWLIT